MYKSICVKVQRKYTNTLVVTDSCEMTDYFYFCMYIFCILKNSTLGSRKIIDF